jgi:hypothetical protein
MQLNDSVYCADVGCEVRVVAVFPFVSYAIVQHEDRYAGVNYIDDESYFFVNEDSPWRDSITDASCDIDIDMNNE